MKLFRATIVDGQNDNPGPHSEPFSAPDGSNGAVLALTGLSSCAPWPHAQPSAI